MLLTPNTASGNGAAKAGKLIPGDFSGAPLKATVTFTTAFDDVNYAIAVDKITIGGAYAHTIEDKLTTGFIVNLNSNNAVGLVEVLWQASPLGE